MTTAGFHARSLSRAPAAVRRQAILAGLLALVAVHFPLVVLFARLQARSWSEMAAAAIFPSPGYYGFFPLQGLRLLIIVLFSLDVAVWVAMLSLLPLDPSGQVGPFESVRRRMRRRWLFIHAPLVPLAGFLAVARLYWITRFSSGAGGAWFVPGLSGAVGNHPALSWIRVEGWLLAGLALYLVTRLTLLTGLPRPKAWARHLFQVGVAVASLTLLNAFLVLPAADGGLSRAMSRARDAENRVCPGSFDQGEPERTEVLFDALVRTPADAPSLREMPQASLPHSVTALPPLPFVEGSGLSVILEGGTPPGLAAGLEIRVDGTGTPFALPLPSQCSKARVLKADRGLAWSSLLPVLRDIGPGPLQLAFRPAPLGRPLNASPGPLRLVLARLSDLPPGLEAVALPLPFHGRINESPPDWDLAKLVRLASPRTNPFRREHPLDPLWQPILPLVFPPAVSPAGDVAFIVPAGLAWDDLLRALASTGEAKRVFLVGLSDP